MQRDHEGYRSPEKPDVDRTRRDAIPEHATAHPTFITRLISSLLSTSTKRGKDIATSRSVASIFILRPPVPQFGDDIAEAERGHNTHQRVQLDFS